MIGYLCFPGEQERDFGYLFHRQWHGKGYAQEAARGFSESNRRKIREKLGISGDALVVGHVGRFQVQKNHEAILRIFHEIQRKEPAARLCLIGDGELKEQIQEPGHSLRV